MRELLLLRHVKAMRSRRDDIGRPIKDSGKRAAQRVGAYLAKRRLLPDLIVTSHAERAVATAVKCAKAAQMDARRVTIDQRLYGANLATLRSVLAECAVDATRVMLVGHNPGLRKLACWLVPAAQRVERMRKGSLVRIELPDDWSSLDRGQGTRVDIVDAAALPRRFPFPSPDGKEERNRPAYYYTQSSVLPYRLDRGQLELLIVRSSQNKRWVVPKGIAEPGMSLHESASKEAWEEAGVVGEVIPEPIGVYAYEKWGATCTVTLYPMRVTRILGDAEWKERHRGRQWVSAQVASMLVGQPELAEMIRLFGCRLNDSDS